MLCLCLILQTEVAQQLLYKTSLDLSRAVCQYNFDRDHVSFYLLIVTLIQTHADKSNSLLGIGRPFPEYAFSKGGQPVSSHRI